MSFQISVILVDPEKPHTRQTSLNEFARRKLATHKMTQRFQCALVKAIFSTSHLYYPRKTCLENNVSFQI